jgi:hypothetical protein
MCSFKRSPPVTETEALLLAEETHMFGYKPEIMELPIGSGHWHLKIRGDGTDDAVFAARLAQLRKPKWTSPTPNLAAPVPATLAMARK